MAEEKNVLTLEAAAEKGKKFCDTLAKYFKTGVTDDLKAALAAENKPGEELYYSGDYTRKIPARDVGLPGGGVVEFLMGVPVDGVEEPTLETDEKNGTTITKGVYSRITIDGKKEWPNLDAKPVVVDGKMEYPKFDEPLSYIQLMMQSADDRPNGIVLSNHIYRRGDPLFYSEALYYSWRHFNRPHSDLNAGPGNIEPGVMEKVRALRYLVQFKVDNSDSKHIIEQVYKKFAEKTQHDEDSNTEVARCWCRHNYEGLFHALLGTPNGAFVGRLLTQHFAELLLDIEAIWTIKDMSNSYQVLYVLGPH
ncbi:hypothetical protein F5884DRAFT_756833 [Xylogone sp. PMI_703]|nr:hypothetical protein F5884DRAFT_756833 [Xylogone sp. PMI_703]